MSSRIDQWKVGAGIALALVPPMAAALDKRTHPGIVECRPGTPHPVHGHETPSGGPLPGVGAIVRGTGTGTDSGTPQPPADAPWEFWQQAQDDGWHQAVHQNLRRQRGFVIATGTQVGWNGWD